MEARPIGEVGDILAEEEPEAAEDDRPGLPLPGVVDEDCGNVDTPSLTSPVFLTIHRPPLGRVAPAPAPATRLAGIGAGATPASCRSNTTDGDLIFRRGEWMLPMNVPISGPTETLGKKSANAEIVARS